MIVSKVDARFAQAALIDYLRANEIKASVDVGWASDGFCLVVGVETPELVSEVPGEVLGLLVKTRMFEV